MQNLYYLPIGPDAPNIINVVIEVPKGSTNKFEYNPDYNIFELDRVLYSPMHYPGGYGFIPNTLGDDGDPLDVIVLTNEPTFTGSLVHAIPLGYLDMTDDKGGDEKILAVPVGDPRYNNNRDLDSISPHRLKEISHFFKVYKDLEGKSTHIGDWHKRDATHALIKRAQEQFKVTYLGETSTAV